MSKEFKWTDELILKFVQYTLHDSPTFQGRYKDLEEFKASHSTEDKIEWEIVSLKYLADGNVYPFNAMPDEKFKIHSVRRLSDGEIFTVGDWIEFDGFGGLQSAAIHRFEVNYFEPTQISAYNGAYGLGCQRWKKTPQRTKLFTTEDGVEVFEGESYWYVSKEAAFLNEWEIQRTNSIKKPINVHGVFSTEEKSKEYVLMNKPVLSVSDLLALKKEKGRILSTYEIKELAKSKI